MTETQLGGVYLLLYLLAVIAIVAFVALSASGRVVAEPEIIELDGVRCVIIGRGKTRDIDCWVVEDE
jgi:hypothetical protein